MDQNNQNPNSDSSPLGTSKKPANKKPQTTDPEGCLKVLNIIMKVKEEYERDIKKFKAVNSSNNNASRHTYICHQCRKIYRDQSECYIHTQNRVLFNPELDCDICGRQYVKPGALKRHKNHFVGRSCLNSNKKKLPHLTRRKRSTPPYTIQDGSDSEVYVRPSLPAFDAFNARPLLNLNGLPPLLPIQPAAILNYKNYQYMNENHIFPEIMPFETQNQIVPQNDLFQNGLFQYDLFQNENNTEINNLSKNQSVPEIKTQNWDQLNPENNFIENISEIVYNERELTQNIEKFYKCKICDLYFENEKNFNEHEILKHESLKQWKCLKCGKSFISEELFEKHTLQFHSTTQGVTLPNKICLEHVHLNECNPNCVVIVADI